MQDRKHRPDHAPSPQAAARRERSVAPGKRTLTMGLAARQPARAAAVQRRPATTQASPPRSRGAEGPVEDWMAVALRPDLHQEPIMRKSMHELGYAGAGVASAPADGSGRAMPPAVQAKMGQALGMDFSNVRIHEGSQAQAIGALAYTQGTNIHFAPGQYDPESQRGQELLGHELTHVVQQAQGRVAAPVQGRGMSVNDDTGLEREADEMGALAARGQPVQMRSTPRAGAAPSTTTAVQCVRREELTAHEQFKKALSDMGNAKAVMDLFEDWLWQSYGTDLSPLSFDQAWSAFDSFGRWFYKNVSRPYQGKMSIAPEGEGVFRPFESMNEEAMDTSWGQSVDWPQTISLGTLDMSGEFSDLRLDGTELRLVERNGAVIYENKSQSSKAGAFHVTIHEAPQSLASWNTSTHPLHGRYQRTKNKCHQALSHGRLAELSGPNGNQGDEGERKGDLLVVYLTQRALEALRALRHSQ